MRVIEEACKDGVLYERVVDNEQGKKITTTYRPDGSVASTVTEDYEASEQMEQTPTERITQLEAQVNELTAIIAGDV